MSVSQLLQKYPIISDQITPVELRVLLTEFEKMLEKDIDGDVAEFGCYTGTSSLFLRRLLNEYASKKQLHVYDSFAGLPEKQHQDQSPAGMQFVAGELFASKAQLIKNFRQAGLEVPVVHKGWFSDLNEGDVPKSISFAFLDGDYYQSVMDPLILIENKLTPGAIVVVDDYANEALPGAAKAVNEWANKHNLNVQVQASLAIIRL